MQGNYRLISLLSAIFKLFERLLYNQFYDYKGLFFSSLIGGYRHKYSTQHVLLNVLQRCKDSIDNKGVAGGFFMALSNAFDSVHDDVLIAKLNAYGLNREAL